MGVIYNARLSPGVAHAIQAKSEPHLGLINIEQDERTDRKEKPAGYCGKGRGYSPEADAVAPERMIGAVGESEPSAFSMVTPNALAGIPLGSGGRTTLAVPAASGLNNPAGIGLPLTGMTHSS